MVEKILNVIIFVILELKNAYRRMIFLFDFKRNRILKKNKDLMQSSSGQDLYILLNGPSLKEINLDHFKDKKKMVVNYFYKGDIPKDFIADYYCALDINVDYNHILEYYNPQTKYLLNYDFHQRIKEKISLDNFYFCYDHLMLTQLGVKFSFHKTVTQSVNVLNNCIMWAFYMGFKKIYIYGADYNFDPKLTEHFYDSDSNSKGSFSNGLNYVQHLEGLLNVYKHHYLLRRKAEKNNIVILNKTRDSKLDAYLFDSV